MIANTVRGGGGGTPLYGYGFSAALVINRVSIFPHSSLEFGLSRAPVTRWAPGVFKLKLTRHHQFISRVSNFWSCHKKGRENRRCWS